MKVLIVTSKATSLTNVAKDIATVLQKNGFIPRLTRITPSPFEIRNIADSVILIYPASPLFASPYFLMHRDYRKIAGIPSVFYATIEGKVTPYLVKSWMKRDLDFIANSKYTKNKLEEAGFGVTEVIYHGLVPEVVEEARKLVPAWRQHLESQFGDRVIFGTISFWHKRKGLDRLAQAVKLLQQKRDDFVVHLITSSDALKYISPSECLVIEHQFGKRTREEVLAWMGALDFLIVPSLAEGFGLPVIEANAMGTPVIHCAFPPLTEVTIPDANIMFFYDVMQELNLRDGILYELHYYKPQELMKAMNYAIDMIKNNKQEYEKRCKKAKESLDKFNAFEHYTKFIKYLSHL